MLIIVLGILYVIFFKCIVIGWNWDLSVFDVKMFIFFFVDDGFTLRMNVWICYRK